MESQTHSTLNYAGFSARMLAHNFDLIILLPFFYLIGEYVENNFMLVGLCFALYVIYHSVFEMTKWRGTPGKKLQKMKVTDAEGQELSVLRVFGRNILKILSALIVFIGFAMISWDPKRQGLHDRLAGSIVIF